jgi:phospholipase C
VHEPNISPWRRTVCGDLTAAFDFSRRDTASVSLPDTDGYRPADDQRHPDYVPTPPATGRLPRQERGVRPARPLKYVPHVDASAGPAAGTIALTFASGPHTGAGFLVTSADGADEGPWTYTAAAGRTVSGTWDRTAAKGAYDLTVHGPNGFLREFAGTAGRPGTAPEVTARHTGGDLELTFTAGGGSGPVRFRLAGARGGARTVRVRAGEHVRHRVELAASRRWYDVTVTVEGDPAFRRRFAGHVENGRPGVSDPALGGE